LRVPFAARDLPASAFPFTIEFIAQRTGNVVHSITVSGPGAAAIPALKADHGLVDVRITYADGVVVYEKANTSR